VRAGLAYDVSNGRSSLEVNFGRLAQNDTIFLSQIRNRAAHCT
jgi:hypothetical protein